MGFRLSKDKAGGPGGARGRTRAVPAGTWLLASLLCLACASSARAEPQVAQDSAVQTRGSGQQAIPPSQPSETAGQTAGTIQGAISSQDGYPVVGATVTLESGESARQRAISDENGNFLFPGVAIGNFQLTVSAPPFQNQTLSGVLAAGQDYVVPAIVMALSPLVTTVRVYPRKVEAAREVKQEEQQRVLGFMPNFYVSYASDPVSLDSGQKFDLAWKSSIDPVTIGSVAAWAGIEQAGDWYNSYGQGAQGYGKRFGAGLADMAVGTVLGGAMGPAVFHQDPRYFYKGEGSAKSRLWYALSRAVIARGDNGRSQVNYSNILGTLGASGISTLYYPAQDKDAAFVFETAGMNLAQSAFGNVFEEFLSRKLTPALSSR